MMQSPSNKSRRSSLRNQLHGVLTLRQRRRFRMVLELASIAMLGLSLFFTVQALSPQFEQTSVVISSRNIAKGERFDNRSLMVEHVPASRALTGASQSIEGIRGKRAQVDIGKHQLILTSMARASPTIPDGYTSIKVSIASALDGITVGDLVDLVSQSGCPSQQQNPPTCILVKDAVVLDLYQTQDANANVTLVCAMSADRALLVLDAQEQSAIMAVTGAV